MVWIYIQSEKKKDREGEKTPYAFQSPKSLQRQTKIVIRLRIMSS